MIWLTKNMLSLFIHFLILVPRTHSIWVVEKFFMDYRWIFFLADVYYAYERHQTQCSTDKNSNTMNVLYGFRKWFCSVLWSSAWKISNISPEWNESILSKRAHGILMVRRRINNMSSLHSSAYYHFYQSLLHVINWHLITLSWFA